MAKITVDGTDYEVTEGRTILQALDDLGVLMTEVEIPHYCWHPKLTIDGSCRLCQVEIEGFPKLQIACNTPVKDGMVIRTQNERVAKAREGVMELLLVNHPLDCPICDQAGECKLQDYAFEYGVAHSRTREPRRALAKKVDLGPTIVFDQERCILCRRCVRFTREISKTGELAVFSRGDRSTIETLPGAPLENDYSMNVADICPVGALTTKDFRFKIRVWFLEDAPGVCTGCSNGCNVHMGVASNKVYRYVPRRNDAVNETWLCDDGRLSYKAINASDRLGETQLRGAHGLRPAGRAEAVSHAAALLGRAIEKHGRGAVAGVASAHACNEDLAVLKKLLDGLGARGCVPMPKWRADDLLRKPERAANAAGARAARLRRPRGRRRGPPLRRGEGARRAGPRSPAPRGARGRRCARRPRGARAPRHAPLRSRALRPRRLPGARAGRAPRLAHQPRRAGADRGAGDRAGVRGVLRGRDPRRARPGARRRGLRRRLRRGRRAGAGLGDPDDRHAGLGMIEVIIKMLFIVLVMMGALLPLITWVERKQAAIMQDRIGANRADLFGIRAIGLLHPAADVLKLITKEDVVPRGANRVLHLLAPVIALVPAIITLAVIPFGGVYQFGETRSRWSSPTSTGACSTSSRSGRSPPTAP